MGFVEEHLARDLRTIGVRTSSGDSVPLNQVADVYTIGELNRIMRYNQERTITVSAKNQVLKASEMFALLEPVLEEMAFPPFHYWEVGGELEDSAKAQKNLAKWMLPCFGGIIFLLVWQFNSLRKPTIVLATFLFALVGVAIGLVIIDRLGLPGGYFGFMTLLGIVSLAGIVINNGIVLIDRIDIEINENHLSPPQAVIQAAQQRFRPIMLTTATTISSLIPLYVGGEEMFQPMAVAIMAGLSFGTLLTMFLVPVLYATVYGLKPEGAAE